jgi:hypothetical protein
MKNTQRSKKGALHVQTSCTPAPRSVVCVDDGNEDVTWRDVTWRDVTWHCRLQQIIPTYCNKFAGSISQWKFITLKAQYTTVEYSSQHFWDSNTRMTDSRITATTSNVSWLLDFNTGSLTQPLILTLRIHKQIVEPTRMRPLSSDPGTQLPRALQALSHNCPVHLKSLSYISHRHFHSNVSV